MIDMASHEQDPGIGSDSNRLIMMIAGELRVVKIHAVENKVNHIIPWDALFAVQIVTTYYSECLTHLLCVEI